MPELVGEAVRRHGSAVLVAIDARQGKVALRGWVDQTAVAAVEVARSMKDLGVERIIYTDVARDGMLSGVNVEETANLALAAGLRVIASGGVSSIEDVRWLWDQRRAGVEGVILGRALYERRLDFRSLSARVGSW